MIISMIMHPIYTAWLTTGIRNNKLIQHGSITYSGLGTAMKADFPEIQWPDARVLPGGDQKLTYGNKIILRARRLFSSIMLSYLCLHSLSLQEMLKHRL